MTDSEAGTLHWYQCSRARDYESARTAYAEGWRNVVAVQLGAAGTHAATRVAHERVLATAEGK